MYEQLAQSKETTSLLHPAANSSEEELDDENRPAGAPSVYQSLPQNHQTDGAPLPSPHKQLLDEEHDDPTFVAMEMAEMDADNLPTQSLQFRGLQMANAVNGPQSAGALRVLKNAPEPSRVHAPP